MNMRVRDGYNILRGIEAADTKLRATPWYRVRDQIRLRRRRRDGVRALDAHIRACQSYFEDRALVNGSVVIQRKTLPPEDVLALRDCANLLGALCTYDAMGVRA